jgi:hypothetical protein
MGGYPLRIYIFCYSQQYLYFQKIEMTKYEFIAILNEAGVTFDNFFFDNSFDLV